MKKMLIPLILISCILFSFLGCSSDSVNDEGSTKTTKITKKVIDPTELISKTEAEALLKTTVKDAEKKDNAVVGQKIANYNDTKEDSLKFLQVSLSQDAFTTNEYQKTKDIYTNTKNAFPDAEKVQGIGDEAFISPQLLHILKGEYYIVISVGNLKTDDNREIIEAAGKKAVENLNKLTSK